jgi:nucleotide-binding universal stress UspA family protein
MYTSSDMSGGVMENIIVVGVDASDSARRAARAAAVLAANSGAVLHVLSAVEKVTASADAGAGLSHGEFAEGAGIGLTLGEVAEAIAAEVAAELGSIAPTVVSGPLHGKPADALVEEARRLDARLIVVGNRRVQGIGRILGSVAASVAHQAPCDVYIVKTV